MYFQRYEQKQIDFVLFLAMYNNRAFNFSILD